MTIDKIRFGQTSKQFFTYAAVGALGTSGHFVTLIALVESLSFNTTVASTFGFIVGAIINYVLNYCVTFKSKRAHSVSLARFFTVAILGVFLNGCLMFLGSEIIGVHYLIVQVCSTGIVLVLNFVLNRSWTFA